MLLRAINFVRTNGFRAGVEQSVVEFRRNFNRAPKFAGLNETREGSINIELDLGLLHSSPKVSFVIPCFRQAKFVSEAVASCAAATNLEHECIVIDDGNESRRELALLSALRPYGPHQRIRVARNNINNGLAAARNIGVALSESPYIKFVDADDLLVCGSVDIEVELAELNKESVIVSEYVRFWEEGLIEPVSLQPGTFNHPFQRGGNSLEWFIENWESTLSVPIHSALFPRHILPRFDQRMRNREDMVFWGDIFASGASFTRNSEVSAIYRMHRNQMTRSDRSGSGAWYLEALLTLAQRYNVDSSHLISRIAYVKQQYGSQAIRVWSSISRDRKQFIRGMQLHG